jgi:N-acetylglucosamine-6-phosphate deacetylase
VTARPLLFLEDGVVTRVTTQDATAAPSDTMQLTESTLSPGFLDVHVHGAGGRDVMEGSNEAIATVGRMLAKYGTTRFLATTVSAGIDHTLSALDGIANAIERGLGDDHSAMPIGIHLEGPFLSHEKRGVHPPEVLQKPTIELFDRFHAAARGHIQLMTVAPELPGALDLIAHATAKGVRVSLGHSNALAAEARAGIAAGGVSATHTFNAMRGLTQREPGMLGVVLDAQELYAELICDGVHTTPEAVRLWLKMKGLQRALLVTDGMAATGMPDGDYMLGEMLVMVSNGVALHEGTLAGSVLTMERAVANVQSFTGIDLPAAVRLASYNPAAMLGMGAWGDVADFNVFNDAGAMTGTILRGRML